MGDSNIPGDEDQFLHLSLRDQHSVERVSVMRRKRTRLLGVKKREIQRDEVLFLTAASRLSGAFSFPSARLTAISQPLTELTKTSFCWLLNGLKSVPV